jgi:hypothetical protein
MMIFYVEFECRYLLLICYEINLSIHALYFLEKALFDAAVFVCYRCSQSSLRDVLSSFSLRRHLEISERSADLD